MEDNPLLDRLRQARQTKKPTRSSDPFQNQADETIESALRQGAFNKLDGAGKPLEPDNKKKQPPLTAARVGSIAEQRIQAAMDEGMFDNLPGMGQPLDLYVKYGLQYLRDAVAGKTFAVGETDHDSRIEEFNGSRRRRGSGECSTNP